MRANGVDGNLSDSSGYSGRGHSSSSVPRTRFTQTTPHSQREAINKLKTRMTFSDHSTNSSIQSSPKRKLSGHSLDANSKQAPPNYVLEVDNMSEGEIPFYVSIPDILSKLDSVKNYLKEAEGLQKQLKEKLPQVEASAQLKKLDRLIQDLRQQETTYLGILLRVMDNDDSQLNTTQETDSEYSDGDNSDDEDDTLLQDPASLSLKSQLDKSEEMTPDQEEELRVLRQQQQMLRELIDHQEKLKELEEKQAELLRKKTEAQRHLVEAEAKTQEYHRQIQLAASHDTPVIQPEEDNDDEQSHREALLNRIAALKERKDKLEGLMDSFTQMQLVNEEEEETTEPADTKSVDQSDDGGGASEIVATPINPEDESRMEEIEAKLRQAAEAKHRLVELRNVIDNLKTTTEGNESLQWRLALGPRSQTDPEEEQPEEEGTNLDDKNDELDESLVMDYQQRLAHKREEVADLQKQKEELIKMQSQILSMQEKYLKDGDQEDSPDDRESESEDEGGLPAHLAEELRKQQELYQEIMSKTKKLKDLRVQYHDEATKMSEHDTYSLTSSTRLLTDADLTAATWGGSTVQSDESEESGSSASIPVTTAIPKTNTGSATAVQRSHAVPQERVKFTVTRHTPRRQPGRRTLSDAGESPQSVDKKRKLNATTSTASERPKNKTTGAGVGATSQFSAVWPGVIFPSKKQSTKSNSTQTPSHSREPRFEAGAEPQVTVLSDMCSELLRGQNALIYTLCQRVSVDTDANQLHNYHRDLDMYYQNMCQAYAQLPTSQNGSPGSQSQPTDDATPRAEHYQQSADSNAPRPPPVLPTQATSFLRPSYQPGWYTHSPMMPTQSPYTPQVGSPLRAWNIGATGFGDPSRLRFTATESGQGIRDSVLNSPSGNTTASVQVQAPSTPPPSASPSLNNQPYCFDPPTTHSRSIQLPTQINSLSYQTVVPNTETGITVSQSAPTLPSVEGVVNTTQEDVESLSSMPLSEPDIAQLPQSEAGGGFSVFDALRETIYSEVATLIANNESRPHFLVELFRELQLLNSDYLRQRALYNIQDLVTRFLTGENKDPNITYQDWVDSDTCSEVVTHDEDPSRAPLSNATSDAFDYVELVQSSTSLVTPPTSDQPFTELGDTVIRLDKALARTKSEAETASPSLVPPIISPGSLIQDDQDDSEPEATAPTEMDRQILDDHIKDIMTEVIPVLKANMAEQCSQSLLDQIKNIVMDLVMKQEIRQDNDFLEMLTKQLESTVTDTLDKYIDKQFRDCGEDMLVDLSEVLLNELSFFRLMQNLRDHPQLGSDFRSVTSSQTTTEPEDNEGSEEHMDPILLQALALQASRTIVDEEEALGKTRDDEMAKTWEPSVQSDEDRNEYIKEEIPNETIDQSIEVTPVNQDSPTERDDTATPVPVSEEPDNIAMEEPQQEATPILDNEATPVLNNAAIESVETIVSQISDGQSPLGHSLENTLQVTLDIHMKQEQESIEGIPGIITSIEQQGQELAGLGDEPPPPTTEP